MSDTERAAEIRARLNAATPGPWTWKAGRDEFSSRNELAGANGSEVITSTGYIDYTAEVLVDAGDAELLANAPADLAWALDRITQLEAENERLRARASRPRRTIPCSRWCHVVFGGTAVAHIDSCPNAGGPLVLEDGGAA